MDRSFIELLKRISTIPSPTFREKEKGELIASLLARAGLRVCRDELYNVLAWSGEELPRSVILIEAHMDTVFDESVPLNWVEDDGTIRCPSVADNSVALAALITGHGGRNNLTGRPECGFRAGATTREEGPGKGEGMKRLIEGISRAPEERSNTTDLAGRLNREGRITIHLHRFYKSEVSIETTGGHPWLEPAAPSAVHIAAAIVSKIVDSSGYRESPKTTVNVGTICGGTLPTVRASESYFTLDIRSVDRESLHKTSISANVGR
jgi:acetylornithine deacetylase/succinyl-diaminopimelate desuccinylase-like protein